MKGHQGAVKKLEFDVVIQGEPVEGFKEAEWGGCVQNNEGMGP